MNLVELTIAQPDNAAEARAHQALTRAESMSVTTADEYQAAADEVMAIKSKWKEIEDARKALKQPVDEAAKRIQSFFKPPLDFLARAENIIKRKMVSWKSEQDRIAREEQRKAEEKARKERERLEREAAKAAAAGREERAEVLRERAEVVVSAPVAPVAPKVSGISERSVWKFEIVDAAKIPREFLMPNEKRIGEYVRAMKSDATIPGVRIFEETSLASRRA
jgi:hypothetical protein